MLRARIAFVLLTGLVSAAPAQQALAPRPVARSESAERARVRALVGDLGLPELPAAQDGPRDSIFFADRLVQAPATADSGPGDARLQTVTLSGSQTGTGKPEVLWYQLPDGYDPLGPPHPMVVAWHGFGSSAFSVSQLSTLDEECNAHNWVYLSVTGIDDQLFGSPISQDNAAAGIQWMLDNFHVDPDRLYMVGFSMGGGIVTSFASRHRDPAGIMIAALGTVSLTADWTETWVLAPPSQKTLMESEFNFGGPPSTVPFAYQRVSSLYFTPGSYPPTPGTPDAHIAMGDNLGNTPLWLTWDTADPVAENPPAMGAALAALVGGVGGEVQTHPVSGTSEPHSWDVLDEAQLFAFFEGRTVERHPAQFKAQLDEDAAVSWTTTTQAAAGEFSRYDGFSDPATQSVMLIAVENVAQLALDGAGAGLAQVSPLSLVVDTGFATGLQVELTGFDQPPSYLLATFDGSLVEGTQSEPLIDSLLVDVAGFSQLDASVVSEPWLGDLYSTPEPAQIAAPLAVTVDMPVASDPLVMLVVSADELLTHIKGGHVITADAFAPGLLLLLPLPLSPAGDVELHADLPNDPLLHGVHVVMQGVSFTPGGQVGNISNLWALHVD